MMFHSNQVLEISGCLEHRDELKNALEFVLNTSGELQRFTRTENPAKCVYQITDNGKFCIGWSSSNLIKTGWHEFPFTFDIDVISSIICKHLDSQEIHRCGADGSYRKGFIMRVIPETLDSVQNYIKNPFYGIVEFSPFTCFYSK